jgi:N-acetylmuramoyl-L-alanine amidase
MITTTLLCLTLNIFHESRGESIDTQEAVAAITLNRSRKWGKGVCMEVYSPGSFSWTRHSHLKIKEKLAFERAKRIATAYLSGKVNHKIGDRLYFNERRLGKRFRTKHKPIILGRLMMY